MSNRYRILIVDDNEAIHEDFRKILTVNRASGDKLAAIEKDLFEDEASQSAKALELLDYQIDSAFQGKQAIEMVDKAAAADDPYAMIFMDVRMPPGINGIETIELIWAKHPDIEMVIVTAFSDYSWEEILARVGSTDRLMFLRKPFDQVTVKQLTLALCKKYRLNQQVQQYLNRMENEIHFRSNQLESMVQELKALNS